MSVPEKAQGWHSGWHSVPPEAYAGARAQAQAQGVGWYEADLSTATDKATLMQALAEGLKLPEWFGRNWDALADLLGDPDFVAPRSALYLRGLDTLSAAQPELAHTLQEVLADAQAAAAQAGGQLWLLREERE